jgi:HSP20 family protein
LIRINEEDRGMEFPGILAGSSGSGRNRTRRASERGCQWQSRIHAVRQADPPSSGPGAPGDLGMEERRRWHLQLNPQAQRRSAMTEAAPKLPVKKASVPPQAADWSPFESLRQEVDRLFDGFRPLNWHFPSKVFGFETPNLARLEWEVAPAIDLAEKDDSYEITAELPGIDEKNVEIKLSNHTLTIKGEKSEEKEEKRKDYYLSERRYGSFQRSFQLPDGVDADRIEAKFSKGVLTVNLPKTVEAKKAEKKITVKAA